MASVLRHWLWSVEVDVEGVETADATLLDIPAERTVTVNEDAAWLRQDPRQEQEWIRQLSLIYSGLRGIGVVMVQPFLTAASLDLSAKSASSPSRWPYRCWLPLCWSISTKSSVVA